MDEKNKTIDFPQSIEAEWLEDLNDIQQEILLDWCAEHSYSIRNLSIGQMIHFIDDNHWNTDHWEISRMDSPWGIFFGKPGSEDMIEGASAWGDLVYALWETVVLIIKNKPQ